MNQHGDGVMIVEGDGTLQKRFDNGLCPFCECEWNPLPGNVCRYCKKVWTDHHSDQDEFEAAIQHQINKTGSLE